MTFQTPAFHLHSDAECHAALSGHLDVYTAADLRRALAGRIASSERLEVDLSEVQACDLTGLQLLVSAVRTAHGQGRTVVYSCPSEAVRDCCAGLGLGIETICASEIGQL